MRHSKFRQFLLLTTLTSATAFAASVTPPPDSQPPTTWSDPYQWTIYALGPPTTAYLTECEGENYSHTGDIEVDSTADIDGVRCLRRIFGQLRLKTGASGFSLLQWKLPWLEIVSNGVSLIAPTAQGTLSIDEIHFLRVRKLLGTVKLDLNPNVEWVGLPQMTSLDNLEVTLRTNNSDLHGLDNISSIPGALKINNPNPINPPLTNGLNGLLSVGNLSISGYPATANPPQAFMTSLSQVAGNVSLGLIGDNPNFVRIYGVNAVTAIGGALSIKNTTLNQLDGFGALTSVAGDLVITGNASLPNCTAHNFAQGISVGGATVINSNLADACP